MKHKEYYTTTRTEKENTNQTESKPNMNNLN